MTGDSRRWPLPVLGLGLLVLSLGALMLAVEVYLMATSARFWDYGVYRDAIDRLLAGGSLYEQVGVDGAAPFLYPPFAALLMLPMAGLSLPVGMVVWALAQLACCVVLAALVGRNTSWLSGLRRLEAGISVGLGALLLAFSEPMTNGLWLGQISLAVATAVVIDLCVVPPRWRGWLTGVAAAVKITPAVFILYLLVTRQWRACANLVGGFAGATVLAWLVWPDHSADYWTRVFSVTGMVTEPGFFTNKSLMGVIARSGLDAGAQHWLWPLLAVAVTALGTWQARRRHQRGDAFAGILTMGFTVVVASPLSWSHYLVWLPLTGLYLVASGRGWTRWLGVALLVAFLVGTPLLDSTAWTPGSDNVAAFVMLAFACLGVPAGSAGITSRPIGGPVRVDVDA